MRAAAASPTPVGARYSPNTSRSVCAHSPVVAPARAAAIVAGMMFSPSSRGDPRELRERLVDRGLVALGAPALERRALLGLDLRVDHQDRRRRRRP